MYLSNTEIIDAIQAGDLIAEPFPVSFGTTSFDVQLADIEDARVWNMEALAEENKVHGRQPRDVPCARINYRKYSKKYTKPVPREKDSDDDELVVRRDDAIVIRPGGFVLWQTHEKIGTPVPKDGEKPLPPKYICFIQGKSTRARTGLAVHLTAPTIHARWNGKVTLEMANVGNLDLLLYERDLVAQITVARVLGWVDPTKQVKSATQGQAAVTGSAK